MRNRNYMRAFSALYGSSKAPEAPRPNTLASKVKPRKKPQAKEEPEHMALAAWLDKQGVLWYHPPNGGKRSLNEGYKLKLMGVKPGVPDICITMARKGFHGLYIELKAIGGTQSDVRQEQRAWLTRLAQEGYKTAVAYGAEQAKAIVRDYFK